MTEHKVTEASGVKAPSYYRQEAWDKLAWVYDSLVRLVFLPFGGEKKFRKKFADFANPEKGEQVLDVCSGTGSLTSLLAERVGDGKVVGVDLSHSMLRIARKRVKVPTATFERANTESLPFQADMFDKAFTSLGLHEMPGTARRNTLKEIYRTLKPRGSVFVLDYNLPRGALARFAIKALVRTLEDKPAYSMLLDGSLTKEIEQAGFEIEKQEFICGGAIQMIQARKGLKEDTDG